MSAGVVDGDEGTVGQARQCAGFVAEAVGSDRVAARAEHLGGHLTAQHLVDAAEDIRRAAGPCGALEPVATAQEGVAFRRCFML
ncbi:hypothetical protein ACFYYS_18790 [Streptomyces sp. NPDC002120]|uniref:hypothetical protein n=1 Tax=Streptomyces sp. NPDC002120 TaxID=3364631 RepID=UPI0036B51972